MMTHPSSFIIGLLALPVAACVASMTGCDDHTLVDGGTYSMQLGGKTFALQVSANDASRTKGLGGVASIPDDGGMIFAFPDSKLRRFWMKGCITDMDIVFVDPLGYVTAVHTMTAQPPQGPNESLEAYEARLVGYESLSPAQFAIELRKGRAAELGIKTRQKLPLDIPALRAVAK